MLLIRKGCTKGAQGIRQVVWRPYAAVFLPGVPALPPNHTRQPGNMEKENTMKHPPRNVNLLCFDWEKLILKHTDMPSNAKFMALYLGTYMNRHKDMAWPSLKTISRETNLAESTAEKWVNFLVDEGWLIKQSGNRTESNRYWINVPGEVPKALGTPTSEVPRQLGYPDEQGKVPRQSGSNNNTNNNTLSNRGRRFVKPSIGDVKIYCIEKGYTFDAETFINFYESNGWKVGKNSMKCWKSACATWNKREQENGRARQNGKSNTRGPEVITAADLRDKGYDID